MKKLIATGAALLMICATFTGCGSDDTSESSAESYMQPSSSSESGTEEINTTQDNSEATKTDSGSSNSTGDYVSGVIDGLESAGENIVDGVGDAAGNVADGVMGNDDKNSSSDNR